MGTRKTGLQTYRYFLEKHNTGRFLINNPHKIAAELVLNWELAKDILLRFIRTETGRAGFSRLVVGLSGGMDSALAAYLASEALGADNVFAYIMPYRTSSRESLEHADKMTGLLGIAKQTIDITPMADAFFELHAEMNEIRRGNVMARLRMIALFDAAMEKNALVLGTGNKTEILLGYSTLYGDSACSLNPIGDLYKTQVWGMAAHFDLPQEIIAKSPSADLWPGQTDEGELGVSYETADEILYRMVDKRISVENIIAEGFDEALVKMIADRVRKYHFKRVMPPIAKLSPRTVGSDFLYSRDWGT